MKPLLLPFILIIFICGCSGPTKTAGGGSEIPNAISGIVLDTNSTPMIGARVLMQKVSIDTSGQIIETLDETLTDNNGYFEIEKSETGSLIISVESEGKIRKTKHLMVNSLKEAQTIDTLKTLPLRTILGKYLVPDFINKEQVKVIVFGIPLHSTIDESGSYVLNDIPSDKEVDLKFITGKIVNSSKINLTLVMESALTLRNFKFSFGGLNEEIETQKSNLYDSTYIAVPIYSESLASAPNMEYSDQVLYPIRPNLNIPFGEYVGVIKTSGLLELIDLNGANYHQIQVADTEYNYDPNPELFYFIEYSTGIETISPLETFSIFPDKTILTQMFESAQ
jgi:hypothetical protein